MASKKYLYRENGNYPSRNTGSVDLSGSSVSGISSPNTSQNDDKINDEPPEELDPGFIRESWIRFCKKYMAKKTDLEDNQAE
jgi:hypothetical protein